MHPAINWTLVVAGAVLILIEVLLGAISGFDFLLIGSAVLLGGILGLLTHSSPAGLAAAGVLSLLYILVGRRQIRARLHRPDIPSNTDAIVGRTGVVVEAIGAHQPGRIKIEGEEWRALPETSAAAPSESLHAVGSSVRVTRLDGVTAFVVKAESSAAEGART